MGDYEIGILDPTFLKRVGMRLYLKVIMFYNGLCHNIHGAATIYNHFNKSFPLSNKGIEDGGTFHSSCMTDLAKRHLTTLRCAS